MTTEMKPIGSKKRPNQVQRSSGEATATDTQQKRSNDAEDILGAIAERGGVESERQQGMIFLLSGGGSAIDDDLGFGMWVDGSGEEEGDGSG